MQLRAWEETTFSFAAVGATLVTWPKKARDSRRNYSKMLDVLMPVSVESLTNSVVEFGTEYRGAIPSIVDLTDVPMRLVVCVDGGTREDVALLQRYLPSLSCEWSLMQNDGVLGLERTMSELIGSVRNEYIAIVPANIWVNDPQWFGKMQVAFTKDQHCFMVASDVPETVSATLPPFRLDYKVNPKSGFFLTRKLALANVGQFSGSEDFSRKANQLGGTRWIAPGVRYGDADYAREKTRTV